MIQSINDILNSCIAIVGLFLVFFLLNNRDFRSNVWLAAFNLVLVAHFINLFLISRFNIPHFGLVYGLLYGPLIMNFILAHGENQGRKDLIHFAPALILFLWIIFVDLKRNETPDLELSILRSVVFLHLLGYIIVSTRMSRKLKEMAIQTRSKIDDDKISLIQSTIRVISFVYFIAIMEAFIIPEQNQLFYQYLLAAISTTVLLGMLGFIYQGLENRFIFAEITEDERQVALEAHKKYASSILGRDESEEYHKKLVSVMDEQKPYKNYNLSLDELAEITNIPPRFLSQVINEQLGRNFFDFINFHRVEEAKKQLKHQERRISEVMYDVGFLSRSSFNTSFKKYAGKTPSQFRKSL